MRTPYEVLLRPIVTEKSYKLSNLKVKSSKTKEEYKICKLTFEVPIDATKPEIKQAVEKLFNVKVEKVNTMIVPGKEKRVYNKPGLKGRKRKYKKAIVTLKKGYELDLTKLAKEW